MARKKTITKEQILTAAYEVVATEGFSKFTARNIANKMKCSTQPIYLEFLKIHKYLAKEVFPVKHTGNTIVDLALNYIHFATSESKLYRALYLEEYGGGKKMQEFSYHYFTEAVKADPEYANLNDVQIDSLHMGTWVVATGVAALMTSGIIHPSEEQIIHLMKDSIEAILERDEPIDIDL